jgi:hypothetical protein
MMRIPRLLTCIVAVVAFGAVSPVAMAGEQNVRANTERLSGNQQRDVDALIRLVDAVSSDEAAPTDVTVAWETNVFVKGGDGTTYVPFTVGIDRSKLGTEDAAIYVRVVAKGDLTPAEVEARARLAAVARRTSEKATYAWTDIHFVEVPDDGLVSRAMSLQPGEYDVFIAVKNQAPRRGDQPDAKLGVLHRDLTVPDYTAQELLTSSIIVANSIEILSSPLKDDDQQESPYTFGRYKVAPSVDRKLNKSVAGAQLEVLFWIYGMQHSDGMPDVSVDFSFHRKTPNGDKYFNKTPSVNLDASTLPEQFDVEAGHLLPGNLAVPLSIFPEGEYRLEIKVTDELSGKTLTQNAAFSVEA